MFSFDSTFKINFSKNKVLEYVHKCRALSSGKLSLVDTSLLPSFRHKPFFIHQESIEEVHPQQNYSQVI